mgnify:CR=1 FL=1
MVGGKHFQIVLFLVGIMLTVTNDGFITLLKELVLKSFDKLSVKKKMLEIFGKIKPTSLADLFL